MVIFNSYVKLPEGNIHGPMKEHGPMFDTSQPASPTAIADLICASMAKRSCEKHLAFHGIFHGIFHGKP